MANYLRCDVPVQYPELVAAASESGAIGVVEPLSLTYVYGYDFREGLRYIQPLTTKPWGLNVIVEQSSRVYERRMRGYIEIALEEGCRFFVTFLGNPHWVVKAVKPSAPLSTMT